MVTDGSPAAQKSREKKLGEQEEVGSRRPLKGWLLRTLGFILKETADRFPTRRNTLRFVF